MFLIELLVRKYTTEAEIQITCLCLLLTVPNDFILTTEVSTLATSDSSCRRSAQSRCKGLT